jgi:hypothetical protein
MVRSDVGINEETFLLVGFEIGQADAGDYIYSINGD